MKEYKIYGKPIDEATRCVHYHTEKDIVAIKFQCCQKYYPCFKCHEDTVSHEARLWGREEKNQLAVMCGKCRHEMSIETYQSTNTCPNCQSAFNPHCREHSHLYFE